MQTVNIQKNSSILRKGTYGSSLTHPLKESDKYGIKRERRVPFGKVLQKADR